VEVEAVSDAETRASGSKNISASKLESPSVRHGDEGVVSVYWGVEKGGYTLLEGYECG